MKVIRKKREGIKIEHNRGLFWVIILAIILLIILIWFIAKSKEEKQNNGIGDKFYCEIDEDCVPNNCCHATNCVNKKYKPNCSDMFCTQVCSGPLDCGAGSCKCVLNGCAIISNVKS